MSDPTPTIPECVVQRAAGATVDMVTDRDFETWPGNLKFTAPQYYNPKTRAELANAILRAESDGHHVRAFGSKWSFSDAIKATTGTPPKTGAMIVTEQLKRSLQSELPSILAPGVDSNSLIHVEAGIKGTDLNLLMARHGQALDSGGCWDLGYPRTVQRPDGKLATLYYFNDDPQHERYIAATIWDPGVGGK